MSRIFDHLVSWIASDLPVHEVVALQVEGAEVGRHDVSLGRGLLLGGAEGVQHGGVLEVKKKNPHIFGIFCKNDSTIIVQINFFSPDRGCCPLAGSSLPGPCKKQVFCFSNTKLHKFYFLNSLVLPADPHPRQALQPLDKGGLGGVELGQLARLHLAYGQLDDGRWKFLLLLLLFIFDWSSSGRLLSCCFCCCCCCCCCGLSWCKLFWASERGEGHTPFWKHSVIWTTLYLSHPVGFNIATPCRRSLNKVCSCLGTHRRDLGKGSPPLGRHQSRRRLPGRGQGTRRTRPGRWKS